MMLLCGLRFISFLAAVPCQHYHYHSEHNQICPAEQNKAWSYQGRNGPQFWDLTYPDCNGTQQSPIAINSDDAIRDDNLAMLTLTNYDQPITRGTIVNNGHTIEVTPQDGINRTISVYGDEYLLQQLHFHWGGAPKRGSEHILDGIQYAMEMHLVHQNADGQLAVVGIFFQEQKYDNEELDKLIIDFPYVEFEDDEAELSSDINLNNLLPANPTSYYRYQGSLTVPTCAQGVTWSVVPDPVYVGTDQMYRFRHLYAVREEDAEENCRLVNNFRPLQPLNGRQVFLSE